ncbi:hypothetical protein ACOSP7_027770 [Xanthoceras sorbifolium]
MESSISNRRLPPGFRFDPTDQQLIFDYLFNKVHGNPYITVIDCDVYGNERLWRRLFEESETDTLYFFTRIKKKTSKGKRIDRKVNIIGSKGCFSFQPKKGFKERCGKWVMHEYMLDGCKKDRRTDTYGPTDDDDVQVNRIHYGMEPQSIVEAAGFNYGVGMSNMVQGHHQLQLYVDNSTSEHQLISFHNMEEEDAERSMVHGLHGCVYDVNSNTSGHHRLDSPDNYMEDEQCHNLERVGLGAAAGGVPQQASVYIGDYSSESPWTMEELEKFLDG